MMKQLLLRRMIQKAAQWPGAKAPNLAQARYFTGPCVGAGLKTQLIYAFDMRSGALFWIDMNAKENVNSIKRYLLESPKNKSKLILFVEPKIEIYLF